MTRRHSQQQNGYLYLKRGRWKLRYYDDILQEDGTVKRTQLSRDLGPQDDAHRTKHSARSLAADFLQPINSGRQDGRSTMTVAKFIETVYLPEIENRARKSTLKDYKDIFRLHVKGRLGETNLRDFSTFDGEELLKTIARQARTTTGNPLRHSTLARIKSFLSGVFTVAKRKGVLDGVNPMVGVLVPAGAPAGITYAYTLHEIKSMLAVLPELARTIVLLAAFAGLRKGEIRGLRWADYTGALLHVRRSVWNKGIENPPKTASSAAPIPVVKILRDALDLHKQREGEFASPDLPIFQSGETTPLSLSNLANRVIIPALSRCTICKKQEAEHKPEGHNFEGDKSLPEWRGWHAFRRGLATNLHELGMPDRDIQAILRHSNIAVTQTSYIKSRDSVQVDMLDLLAERMAEEECTAYAPKSKGSVN